MEPAMKDAYAALRTQARHTAEEMIDARYKKYRLRPSFLDMIEPGLSALTPHQMAARLAALIDRELCQPRTRKFPGGEVPLINLQAAARYAGRLCELKDRHHG